MPVADEPDPAKQVHHITFQGLQVGYTEFMSSSSSGWNGFNDVYGIGSYPTEALQKGITQPSHSEITEREEHRRAVFSLFQTNNITLDSLRILYAGMMGVSVWGDNEAITITNSDLVTLDTMGCTLTVDIPNLRQVNSPMVILSQIM